MTQGTLRRTTRPEDQVPDIIELGQGRHGNVELDPSSMLVCKRFRTSNKDEARSLAQREFDYLKRFSSALAFEPYLSCPEPITVQPEQGLLWMSYCPGKPLDELLIAGSFNLENHVEHLAEQIALALARYIDEFQEPFYDMATKHVLYQPETGVLSFVDFASPAFRRRFGPQHSHREVSAGTFISYSTYDTLRPATCRNLDYWRRQECLSVELLRRLRGDSEVSFPVVQELTAVVYGRLGPRGRLLRWLWYSTVGRMLFRRRTTSIFSKAARERGSDGSIARNSSLDNTDVDRN